VEGAASDSRGRLRPASDEERELSNEGEEVDMSNSTLVFLLFFLLVLEWERSGSATSRMGVGGTVIDMAASFARAWDDFLPLPLAEGVYWEEGVGGWTNLEVCKLDQEVAIVFCWEWLELAPPVLCCCCCYSNVLDESTK
jgi:hypothetical protein